MGITGNTITGFVVDSYSSFIAIGLTLIILLILFSIAIYIYLGFAFMVIGKKAKLKSPGLAWIPFIGPTIVSFQASKMKSWPWWLLLAVPVFFIMPLTFLFTFPAIILLLVYMVIWDWKMFEAINRPGWWTLMRFIPFAGFVVYYVLLKYIRKKKP